MLLAWDSPVDWCFVKALVTSNSLYCKSCGFRITDAIPGSPLRPA